MPTLRNAIFVSNRTFVRTIKNVQGFILPNLGKSINLSAYADDVVVFVSQQSDVQVLMSVLDDFNKLSSAKINWAKSEAV